MEKLNLELEVIKCKIHEEDLDERFKENLERKLNSKCEGKENVTVEKKNNVINKPFYFYKAAAVFVCFVMFSGCAFAGGVGDWLKELFSNVDKEMEIAYENGDIKEVETEYQTFDGVSVKVDYISLKDDELYVVFNVKTEEEYDRVYLNDLIIKDEFGNIIFNYLENVNDDRYKYNVEEKANDSRSSSIFCIIEVPNESLEAAENINIELGNIQITKNDKLANNYGDWSFEILLGK